eukprot:GILK01000631.1.p1 GENE.GILK01000631.1~~GILK01000631.1.p1  ORF type:complete len:187 (+),score=28.59 GILK01000631.1:81-641(+)
MAESRGVVFQQLRSHSSIAATTPVKRQGVRVLTQIRDRLSTVQYQERVAPLVYNFFVDVHNTIVEAFEDANLDLNRKPLHNVIAFLDRIVGRAQHPAYNLLYMADSINLFRTSAYGNRNSTFSDMFEKMEIRVNTGDLLAQNFDDLSLNLVPAFDNAEQSDPESELETKSETKKPEKKETNGKTKK